MSGSFLNIAGVETPWCRVDYMGHGAKCLDCGLPYEEFGDLRLPDDTWERINPTPDRGCGLLCPNCITWRLGIIDAGPVEAVLFAPTLIAQEGREPSSR